MNHVMLRNEIGYLEPVSIHDTQRLNELGWIDTVIGAVASIGSSAMNAKALKEQAKIASEERQMIQAQIDAQRLAVQTQSFAPNSYQVAIPTRENPYLKYLPYVGFGTAAVLGIMLLTRGRSRRRR